MLNSYILIVSVIRSVSREVRAPCTGSCSDLKVLIWASPPGNVAQPLATCEGGGWSNKYSISRAFLLGQRSLRHWLEAWSCTLVGGKHELRVGTWCRKTYTTRTTARVPRPESDLLRWRPKYSYWSSGVCVCNDAQLGRAISARLLPVLNPRRTGPSIRPLPQYCHWQPGSHCQLSQHVVTSAHLRQGSGDWAGASRWCGQERCAQSVQRARQIPRVEWMERRVSSWIQVLRARFHCANVRRDRFCAGTRSVLAAKYCDVFPFFVFWMGELGEPSVWTCKMKTLSNRGVMFSRNCVVTEWFDFPVTKYCVLRVQIMYAMRQTISAPSSGHPTPLKWPRKKEEGRTRLLIKDQGSHQSLLLLDHYSFSNIQCAILLQNTKVLLEFVILLFSFRWRISKILHPNLLLRPLQIRMHVFIWLGPKTNILNSRCWYMVISV